jgi:hypothetical protein
VFAAPESLTAAAGGVGILLKPTRAAAARLLVGGAAFVLVSFNVFILLNKAGRRGRRAGGELC